MHSVFYVMLLSKQANHIKKASLSQTKRLLFRLQLTTIDILEYLLFIFVK